MEMQKTHKGNRLLHTFLTVRVLRYNVILKFKLIVCFIGISLCIGMCSRYIAVLF